MIGYLKGTVIEKKPPEIILDVNGVGYEVTLPLNAFVEIGEDKENDSLTEIYIHTYVKEDILQLYGFTKLSDRSLFRELIKVNGIGAKMAMAILSSMNSDEFQNAIVNNDVTTMTKLPGVGKKTAERLIIEMRDRLQNIPNSNPDEVMSGNNKINDAISALQSLGYKPQEAKNLIEKLPDNNLPTNELIREALKLVR